MYSLRYASAEEQTTYYQRLEQCVKCRKLYPAAESAGNRTLCVFCVMDTEARKYQIEEAD